jgi:hypothetical protein
MPRKIEFTEYVNANGNSSFATWLDADAIH